MKISIQTKEQNICIPISNALVFNRFVSPIIDRALKKRKSFVQISSKELNRLWKALRQARREWGNLILVEVLTIDGDNIRISL